MATESVVIRITGSYKDQITSGVKKTIGSIKTGFGNAFHTVGLGFRRLGNLAEDAFRMVARAAKWASLAVLALGAYTIKLGADVVESENLFVVSMGKMARAAEGWAKNYARGLNMNTNDVKKFLGTFNVMLTSMGLSEEQAYDMSRALTGLAFDMASFYNLSPEVAFEKLQAGITGEIEPLKRLGIVMNETVVKAYALANGIGTAGTELSETEKILARFGVLMEKTTKAQGDMARTSDSASNRFKQIWAAVKEMIQHVGAGITESNLFKSTIGALAISLGGLKEKLLAIDVTAVLNKWTDAAKKFFVETVKIEEIWDGIKDAWNALLGSIVIGTEEKTKRIGSVIESETVDGVTRAKNRIITETTTVQKTLADLSIGEVFEFLAEKTLPKVADAIRGIGDAIREILGYLSDFDRKITELQLKWERFKRPFEEASAAWKTFDEEVYKLDKKINEKAAGAWETITGAFKGGAGAFPAGATGRTITEPPALPGTIAPAAAEKSIGEASERSWFERARAAWATYAGHIEELDRTIIAAWDSYTAHIEELDRAVIATMQRAFNQAPMAIAAAGPAAGPAAAPNAPIIEKRELNVTMKIEGLATSDEAANQIARRVKEIFTRWDQSGVE